jgi:hypothetical protein
MNDGVGRSLSSSRDVAPGIVAAAMMAQIMMVGGRRGRRGWFIFSFVFGNTGLGAKKQRGGQYWGRTKIRFWRDSIFSCNRRLRESFSVCSVEIVSLRKYEQTCPTDEFRSQVGYLLVGCIICVFIIARWCLSPDFYGSVSPCSIGHPPHSSASPVELRLQVGPRALIGEKKNLGNRGWRNFSVLLSVWNAPKGKKLGVRK